TGPELSLEKPRSRGFIEVAGIHRLPRWHEGSQFPGPEPADMQYFVKLLLAHGADVNAKGVNFGDPNTPTLAPPLAFAARSGKTDLAELLLEHKADINTPDDAGQTPLHWALYGDKEEDMVNLLLSKGANV